ncbi:MAG: DNA-directed RNA polymerase subunit beta' [Chloroflexota bacterium]|nr:DNA-directed RNA polymerase subunit beta' [Chloroflexota bacterium]
MLEVNDFNAIRISLASPEQIRSWSYGEVTKPETINYRTLKPEPDGLFCEKIFGPVRDWECRCGKYKRIRDKGRVCEKCGVEIARSKVRRERMGHVELATPVSHIWFAKGIPSQLGLLLDLSPRELERVLYFAKYIITDIDETARTRALEDLDQDASGKVIKLEKATQDRFAEIERRFEDEIADLARQKKARLKPYAEKRLQSTNAVMEQAHALQERLEREVGQVALEPITFAPTGGVIVERRAPITALHVDKLRQVVAEKIDEIERQNHQEVARVEESSEAERMHLRAVADQEVSELKSRLQAESEALRQTGSTNREEIESLEKLQLLSENRYRELHERCPKIFKAGMGAEAIYDIVSRIDLDAMVPQLRAETRSSSAQRRKKAVKRLKVVEALRKSSNRPEWMLFTVLPIIPPDLRPMVQLDGGRFATSDLNDLYRRVINRNNRLKRLMELGAPEIIVRNEKRMLQEAVDSLIDNGRRGRAVAGSSNHNLKSLSDMLRGKQGRFRQNLLGKRVDYSGRSVIVVGPELKLNQCGLPKRMALELFKPFVMHKLVEHSYARNIKSAKRIVERMKPEVWDVLEEVIKDHPVLLNRAPTLHRLGIQAFEPVLIEGSAIQIHPLVCAAFNADFDGDQMAVHVPLSTAAKTEARELMLSTYNLLNPSNGEPIVGPTKDMVLGSYYMTQMRPGTKGEGKVFADFSEAIMAYQMDIVDLRAPIRVQWQGSGSALLETTVGRVIFNEALPERMRFKNKKMDKKALRDVVGECYQIFGPERTAEVVDEIKKLGFAYATKSGTTIAISDITIPKEKDRILAEADQKILEMERQYRRGLITEDEQYAQTLEVWTDTKERVTEAVTKNLDEFGSIHVMAVSGATKGQFQQISQIAGMRGLMADPSGRIIDLPIRSNFREGLSVLEYFISTHGARKGLADTALRTADSGYLTRRLVDVAQTVIVQEEDCGTPVGIWIRKSEEKSLGETMAERIVGRTAAANVVDPNTGEIILRGNAEIDEKSVKAINAAGLEQVYVRSALTCEARKGVCRLCYGRDLARGRLVESGEAVGIIAAQSIGEPGTQLTMRTFHTGGVAGPDDITQGLPRVEELFEARNPKGQALVADIDGLVEISREDEQRKIKIVSAEVYRDEYALPEGYSALVHDGQRVDAGAYLAVKDSEVGTQLGLPIADADRSLVQAGGAVMADGIQARTGGEVLIEDGTVVVRYEDREEREYPIPPSARLRVDNGQRVSAGHQLTEGTKNPQDILRVLGWDAVQMYLLEEVQKVYRSQGVNINDKHIEVIVRQMLRRVRIETSGDTGFLPQDLVDRQVYEDANAAVIAEGGEPATAKPVLLGVTKASLKADSFLAAASFQETTRVLTEQAVNGATDRLYGLKENVIIGKLIPAGTGYKARRERAAAIAQAEAAEAKALEQPSTVDLVAEALAAVKREGLPL